MILTRKNDSLVCLGTLEEITNLDLRNFTRVNRPCHLSNWLPYSVPGWLEKAHRELHAAQLQYFHQKFRKGPSEIHRNHHMATPGLTIQGFRFKHHNHCQFSQQFNNLRHPLNINFQIERDYHPHCKLFLHQSFSHIPPARWKKLKRVMRCCCANEHCGGVVFFMFSAATSCLMPLLWALLFVLQNIKISFTTTMKFVWKGDLEMMALDLMC